ncbi:DNRLRE domain-containing protein, partial [Streptomyces sp. MZ04]|uniref:DNRLRE domain-containing protein n=1 Tax=Streptomyces sp. MZ04 TaxID=2559236 RepID=UPI001432B639
MRIGCKRLLVGLVASAVMGAVLPQTAFAEAEERPAPVQAPAADEGEGPPKGPKIPKTPPRKYPTNSPDPKVTYDAAGTTLDAPTVVHGTGPELSWPKYTQGKGKGKGKGKGAGDALVGYQLHRSTRPDFKPTGATLVAPLGRGATSYKDTTAEPTRADSATEIARRYSYRLLVETKDGRLLASPVRRVGVPKAGHTLRILRSGQSDTTLSSAEPGANLDDEKWLSVGAGDAKYGTTRAALKLSTSGIPKKATVLQAELRLREAERAAKGQLLELSPLKRQFTEESATWRKSGTKTPWSTGGGDASPAVSDTTRQGDTYTWDVTSLTRQWAKRPSTNKGVLLKAADEKAADESPTSSATRREPARLLSSEAPDPAQ